MAAVAPASAIILLPPPWETFHSAEGGMHIVDYAAVGSWIAAAINTVILMALAVICPWWANASHPSPALGSIRRPPVARWFWPALLAAVMTCAALSTPRLTQSLWDDEETSLQNCVLGSYKRIAPEGRLQLMPAGWGDTLFFYDTPNNHVFYNVMARLANSAWRAAAKPGGLQFSEWALRLPAFLAGLGALIVLACLLREIAMPLAGIFAAWILALHPWFNRYCAEARGYTMAMLFICSALLFWRRALLSGQWRWWVLFAAAQVLCLWTWPGALWFFVILNAATPVIAMRGRCVALPHRVLLARWFCCNALAAIVLVQLMAPLVPQLGIYLKDAKNTTKATWHMANSWSYLATGAQWIADETRVPERPEIRSDAKAMPMPVLVALATELFLLAWGAARIVRIGGKPALAGAIAVCGAAALHFLATASARLPVYPQYISWLLPLAVGTGAAGLEGLVMALRRRPLAPMTVPAAIVATFGLFIFITQPARVRGLAAPTEFARESVLLTRPDLNPNSPQNMAIMTAGITDPAYSYDPNLFKVRNFRDLLLLCMQADASGRQLWLNLGHPQNICKHAPITQAFIHNPKVFASHQILRSEVFFTDRMVCRYIPRGIEKVDLTTLLSAEDLRHIRKNAQVSPERYFAK